MCSCSAIASISCGSRPHIAMQSSNEIMAFPVAVARRGGARSGDSGEMLRINLCAAAPGALESRLVDFVQEWMRLDQNEPHLPGTDEARHCAQAQPSLSTC